MSLVITRDFTAEVNDPILLKDLRQSISGWVEFSVTGVHQDCQ